MGYEIILASEPAPYGSTLYALNATTGESIWNFSGYGFPQYGTQITGDVALVITTSGTLYGLNLTTGAQIWNVTVPAIHLQTRPTPVWGDIVLGTSSGLYVLNGTS